MPLPAIGAILGKLSLGTAARSVAGGAARAGTKTATGSRFSRVVNKGRNFGDILSGGKSFKQEDERIRKIDQENQAREDARQGLKKFMLALSSGPLFLFGLYKGVKLLNRSVEGAAASLRQVSPNIAGSFLTLEARRLRRDVRLGDVTGGSFRKFTESRNELEETLLPFRAAGREVMQRVTTFFNKISTDVLDITQAVLEHVPLIGDKLEAIRKKLEEGVGNNPWGQMIQDIAGGKFKGEEEPERRLP